MRVLIVDDDASLRRWTRKLLPRFDVEEASNVAEALLAVERHAVDAMLVDVCLGTSEDRSGIELVRMLRERGWDGAAILISGHLGETLGAEAAAAGADAFLIKAEFDSRALRTLIEHAVASRTGAPSRSNPQLSRALDASLADFLDAAEDEDAVHAERSYRLALFAKDALRGVDHAPSTEVCARLVGVTPETLRLYALVASRWSAADLHRMLVVQRNSEGRRISVSHLAEVAKLPRLARDYWVARVYSEALTVRSLREALRSSPFNGAASSPRATEMSGGTGETA